MHLVPVERQRLAALGREIIIMKCVLYVSETANQTPIKNNRKIT